MQTLKKGPGSGSNHLLLWFGEDSRKIMGPEGACDWTVSITHFLRKLLALSHFADGRTVSGR